MTKGHLLPLKTNKANKTHREIYTASLHYSWPPAFSSRSESTGTSSSADNCILYLDLRTKYCNYPISSILISLSNTLLGRRLFCWNVDYIYPFSRSLSVKCRFDILFFSILLAILGLTMGCCCFIISAEVLFYGKLFMQREWIGGRNDISI